MLPGTCCCLQLIRTTGCDDGEKRPAGSRSLFALRSTGQQVAVSAMYMRTFIWAGLALRARCAHSRPYLSSTTLLS